MSAPRVTPVTAAPLSSRNLVNWQLNALAEALWALKQGQRYFSGLETRGSSGGNTPTLAEDGTIALPMPRDERPAMLEVMVPGLDECSIPTHHLSLMRSDYRAALGTLTDPQTRAFNDYISKPRPSAVFCYNPVRRYHKVEGKVAMVRVVSYVSRAKNISEDLEHAIRKIGMFASLPVSSMLTSQQLATCLESAA